MRYIYSLAILLLTVIACETPLTITANPDDRTTTTGTAANAKMTNELPPEAKPLPPRTDTVHVMPDTLQ